MLTPDGTEGRAMGQYAGWSFEQLFEEKNGCMQANRELERELPQCLFLNLSRDG
jgi:hypothetical protein